MNMVIILLMLIRAERSSDWQMADWCLTYSERSRLVDETSVMFGLTIDDAEYAPSANKGHRHFKDQKGQRRCSKDGQPTGTKLCVPYTLSRLDLSCDSGHCT